MWLTKCLAVIFLSKSIETSLITGGTLTPMCGDPGLPVGGLLVNKHPLKVYSVNTEVKYACDANSVINGPEARSCQDNGTWSLTLPICKTNLALGQSALQSETLLDYEALLAVDGNNETCSFTPNTVEQRWWQIQVPKTLVDSVAVSISPGSFQHFTIFVIELLAGNKALYKPCATYQGEVEVAARELFLCNDGLGHQGEFIYIRDDREGQQYFGLCEVQVFAIKDDSECGLPETPYGGSVEVQETRATYSCDEGFLMIGNNSRICENGMWLYQEPVCREIECPDPVSPKSGYIEVSNFKGRYQYGAVATYHCNPGFILWGNASRVCQSDGSWDGISPTCNPISCGNPPAVVNGLVELINGSTNWNAVTAYSCLPTFSNYGDENVTHVYSSCMSNGNWSSVSLTCMFDPLAASRQIKKGRSLYWNSDQGHGINITTIITIGVLSALIVLSLIITIIVVSHRKASSATNARKISRSSTNQLIHDQLGQIGKDSDSNSEEDYDQKCGVIVYDDLNNPHMVETDHSTMLEQYPSSNDIYQNSTLSTFSLQPGSTPPGSVLGIRSPPLGPSYYHMRLAGTVLAGDRSPMSERSSGDGGSDMEGIGVSHYATIGRRKRNDDIYSSMRRPDGESDDDPYAPLKLPHDEDINEQLYETLRRQEAGDTYCVQEQEMSISSETPSSPCSQNTVRLASNENSQINMADLYARVDINKKNRNRGSCDSSCTSPTGHLVNEAPTLPTHNQSKNFVERLNDQTSVNYTNGAEPSENDIIENGDGEVYSTVQFSTAPIGDRTPIPLPRHGKIVNTKSNESYIQSKGHFLGDKDI